MQLIKAFNEVDNTQGTDPGLTRAKSDAADARTADAKAQERENPGGSEPDASRPEPCAGS